MPTFFGTPFFIIIMRQFFAGLPNSLMEAAKIDGAGEFRRYFSIALPLSKPALTTVGIYAFINAWGDYLAPMIYINKTEKYTLSLGLQGFLNSSLLTGPSDGSCLPVCAAGCHLLPDFPAQLCRRHCNLRSEGLIPGQKEPLWTKRFP